MSESAWDWSVERMAQTFTPRQAASIKWNVLALRECTDMNEHDRRFDEKLRWFGPHQWFCYCLDAIARQA